MTQKSGTQSSREEADLFVPLWREEVERSVKEQSWDWWVLASVVVNLQDLKQLKLDQYVKSKVPKFHWISSFSLPCGSMNKVN